MQKWEFEHAIECSVSIQFAWTFWTNVRNWVLDADVDSIEIQGEFAAGTCGVTHSKSSGRIDWRVTEVVQPRKAVLAGVYCGFVRQIPKSSFLCSLRRPVGITHGG